MKATETARERTLRLQRGALALLGIVLGACGGAPGDRSEPGVDSRSAILITLDTTRVDALSCYGPYVDLTPNLDRIADEGVTYWFAHTVAPITLPAHSSMLTGLYPFRHTVRENGLAPLPQSANTLAETARSGGHQTAAFVAAAVLDAAFGVDQGFDVFDAPGRKTRIASSHVAERDADEIAREAARWLEGRDRTRPFFLWAHFFDPHTPHAPHDGVTAPPGRKGPYYGEVMYMDRAIGTLLDALREDGVLDHATLMIVSDHGEALGEHREDTHSLFCYESTMRVPFLMRYPDGHRKGERSFEVVSVVDVHPTLIEAMGLAVDEGLDGASLYRRVVPDDRGVYFETLSGYINFGWSPLVGWIDSQGKYVDGTDPEFFDVDADPREKKNRLDGDAPDVTEYRKAIARLTRRDVLQSDAETSTNEELLEQIRKLGYVAGGILPDPLPRPLEPTGRPNPRERIQEYYDVVRGMQLTERGDLPGARTLLEGIVRQSPKNWHARAQLGVVLVSMKEWKSALPHFALLAREGPQRAETYCNLGLCLREEGQLPAAIDAMKQAVALDPGEAFFLKSLTQMLYRAGRGAEAPEYEKLLRELDAPR